jgi:hypothetical protein
MIPSIEEKQWSEFCIGGESGLFEIRSSSSSIDKNKLENNKEIKSTPYITRTNKDNGIADFIAQKQKGNPSLEEGNTITIGLDTQTVFYQTSSFFSGQNIQILRSKSLTKNIAMFVIPLIKKQLTLLNWGGNGATLGRLNTKKIMLPINLKGEPDYEYMEQFIKVVMNKRQLKYIRYAEKQLMQLKYREIEPLKKKEWSPFFIDDIAEVSPGKRLTKTEIREGAKPFIGASDANNGITNFVSNTNSSEDKNVLGVNYNGSVVENFYHPYTAIFSDDVKKLSIKAVKGNQYLYLFLKNTILKQKNKYQYAYKFNEARLKRQKIMLPISSNRKPDWKFMKQYMINLHYKKLKEYLNYSYTEGVRMPLRFFE